MPTPQSQRPFWLAQLPDSRLPPLAGAVDAEYVVIGGGMAGLSAAQCLRESGGDVVLVEASTCGSGATGRSSGFITPDSEMELSQLVRRFGAADAGTLWDAGLGACRAIRENVTRFGFACDRIDADSLFVANSRAGVAAVRDEYEAHRRLGLPAQLCLPAAVGRNLGTDQYLAGVRCGGTFAISGAAYARGMREALVGMGVRLFEDSPVVSVDGDRVRTVGGSARARSIIICMDRFAPSLNITTRDNYHAQTFLILSEPLSAEIREQVFPDGPMLVWDTDLTYQYFRLTAEGRLLVGGGMLRNTYARRESASDAGYRRLERYIRGKFPVLTSVEFPHRWPGLIGITKDLLPLAGRRPGQPGQYLAMCGAGLPWSWLAGRAAAEQARGRATPLDRFFDPARAFSSIEPLQPLIGRPATWAASYYLAKNVERGASAQVRARQARVAALMLLGFGALGAAVGYLAAGRGH